MAKGVRFKSMAFLVLGIIVLAGYGAAEAIEKISFGTPIKFHPVFYLPFIAGEERGIWKDNGLDVKWVAFRSGSEMMKAMVAGRLSTAIGSSNGIVQGRARGVPVKAVAFLRRWGNFKVWVPGTSRLRRPADLKGAKLEVTRLGGTTHAFGQVVVRALGMEKDITFIALGSVRTGLAAFKTGKVDATIKSDFIMTRLKVKGHARVLLDIAEYVPRKWAQHLLTAREDFIMAKPDVTRRLVKAVLQFANFIAENRAWTIGRMKSESKYSDEVAAYLYDILEFSRDGEIDPEALRNVVNFAIKYRLVKSENAPPVEKLYTNRFLPGR